MGRLSNLKNWFGVKVDKTFALSDMERVETALKQLQKKYDEISNTHAEARGELVFTEKEIENAKNALKRIQQAAKKIANELDTDISDARKTELREQLRLLKNHSDGVQNTLNMQEQSLDVHKKVISQMNQVKLATKAKLDEVTQLKSQLELKDNFTKTMKKYEGFTQGTDGINIDEALKNIEVKFNAANFKFEDMSAEQDLQSLLRDSDGDDLDAWANGLK